MFFSWRHYRCIRVSALVAKRSNLNTPQPSDSFIHRKLQQRVAPYRTGRAAGERWGRTDASRPSYVGAASPVRCWPAKRRPTTHWSRRPAAPGPLRGPVPPVAAQRPRSGHMASSLVGSDFFAHSAWRTIPLPSGRISISTGVIANISRRHSGQIGCGPLFQSQCVGCKSRSPMFISRTCGRLACPWLSS